MARAKHTTGLTNETRRASRPTASQKGTGTSKKITEPAIPARAPATKRRKPSAGAMPWVPNGNDLEADEMYDETANDTKVHKKRKTSAGTELGDSSIETTNMKNGNTRPLSVTHNTEELTPASPVASRLRGPEPKPARGKPSPVPKAGGVFRASGTRVVKPVKKRVPARPPSKYLTRTVAPSLETARGTSSSATPSVDPAGDEFGLIEKILDKSEEEDLDQPLSICRYKVKLRGSSKAVWLPATRVFQQVPELCAEFERSLPRRSVESVDVAAGSRRTRSSTREAKPNAQSQRRLSKAESERSRRSVTPSPSQVETRASSVEASTLAAGPSNPGTEIVWATYRDPIARHYEKMRPAARRAYIQGRAMGRNHQHADRDLLRPHKLRPSPADERGIDEYSKSKAYAICDQHGEVIGDWRAAKAWQSYLPLDIRMEQLMAKLLDSMSQFAAKHFSSKVLRLQRKLWLQAFTQKLKRASEDVPGIGDQLVSLIEYVATGGPDGRAGWEELLLDPELRQAVVMAVMYKVLSHYVLDSLLFGSTLAERDKLAAQAIAMKDEDAFERIKERAALIRTMYPRLIHTYRISSTPGHITKGHLQAAEKVTNHLYALLAPLSNWPRADDSESTRSVKLALRSIVLTASTINWATRACDDSIYFFQPIFKGEVFNNDDAACFSEAHRASLMASDPRKTARLDKENRRRAAREFPLVRVVVTEKFRVCRKGGWQAADTMKGHRMKTLCKGRVALRWGVEGKEGGKVYLQDVVGELGKEADVKQK